MIALLLFLSFGSPAESAIGKVLDDFHQAASVADRQRYFGYLVEDAVFLGTDGGERWSKQAFEKKYGPYMDSGKGWTFRPVSRHISLSADNEVAWFDEALDSEHYGPCRGSGVLVKVNGAWKIAQYNLSIPLPNDLAKDFVRQIREYEQKKP